MKNRKDHKKFSMLEEIWHPSLCLLSEGQVKAVISRSNKKIYEKIAEILQNFSSLVGRGERKRISLLFKFELPKQCCGEVDHNAYLNNVKIFFEELQKFRISHCFLK